MGGNWGNHQEKLGLKRILCARHLTIADRAGNTADPADKNTDTRSSEPKQASHTPDFSNRLTSSILVPIFIPHLSFSTIVAEHNVKLSLSISPCPDHELTVRTAYSEYSIHRVQHILSQAYTEYSIHRVKHTPQMICNLCIFLLTSCPVNVSSASGVPPYSTECHQPALHESSMLQLPDPRSTVAI